MFDASSRDVIEFSDPTSDLSGESYDTDLAYSVACAELGSGHMAEQHVLPHSFEEIPPGPYLAAVVSAVDRKKLNGHDVVRLMQAEARLASHYEAQKLATMVEVAMSPEGGPDDPVERTTEFLEYAPDEAAAALCTTRRAAEMDMNLAYSLTGRLSQVWERFQQGRLDLRRVRVFADQLSHLSQDTVDSVLRETLDDSTHLTTGQLRARVAREVMLVDPAAEDLSYQAGVEDRKVVLQRNPDHTANIVATNLPADGAASLMRHINDVARRLKTGDETRTIDQMRADAFLGLAGSDSSIGSSGGGVHLTVDLATLAGLTDEPAELDGYGPVVADIARKVAKAQAKSTWDFTVHDEEGHVLLTGSTRRRPTASTTRSVAAIYATCVAPGCRMPAHSCDLDHREPWAGGGATHAHNLEPLCRHHHMMKHHAPWQLERLPNGDHQWTTRLGHTYRTKRAPPRRSG